MCGALRLVISVHCVLYIVQWILYTTHCILSTVLRTLYNAYCTLYSVQCVHYTPYKVYFTEYHIQYFTVYPGKGICCWVPLPSRTVHCSPAHGHPSCTIYTVHCTLYSVHCTLNTVHCTGHCSSAHGLPSCTIFTVQCTVYSVQCTLYNVLSTVAQLTTILLAEIRLVLGLGPGKRHAVMVLLQPSFHAQFTR